MHIPGHGFVGFAPSVVTALLSFGGLGLAVGRIREGFDRWSAVRLAAIAAFIFAAQMFNFPTSSGTSGHLLGAVLVAAVAGPWAATVVMAAVLIVQCVLFGDGGYFSLGANIFNMGIIAVWAGWFFYRGLGRGSVFSRYAAAFIASWVSVVAAASAASIEIALSGAAPLNAVLPAMVMAHTTIGVGEGLITVAALGFFSKVMPSLKPRQFVGNGV
jgi:cobalt/nickel transport system permease protein